ncbi:uncharacterized protein LOC105687544 isoform X2 [Athalia rosae]|uniref:uncharacterized protein LOC105687544 isoform X2 n=1 Tax=Athalia rosae TaxID=37344 RepID=UPI002033952B|nr:uncharacterized protein LOC105687544 isoform X2 [Athalia rosae]
MFLPDVTQEKGWQTKNILSISKGSKFLTSTPIKKKLDNELEENWPSPVISCRTTAVLGFPEHKSIIDRHIKLAPKMVIMDSDEEDEFQKKTFSLNHKPKKIKVREQDGNEKVASINNDCLVNDSAENGEILLQKNATHIETSSFRRRSIRLQNTLLSAQHDKKKCNLSKPKNQESKSYEKPASNNKTTRATSSRRKKVPTIVDSDMAKTAEVKVQLTLLENQHRKNINLKTSTKLSETTQNLEPEMPGGVLEEHADSRELMLRRSNRKKCPPLEYWNGERMKISGSPESCLHKNTPQKKLNKGSSDKRVLKIDHPSQKISNTTQDWQISHNPKKRLAMTDEKNELDKPGAKEKRTIKSKRNIEFSTIKSGITIIGPTIAENSKTDNCFQIGWPTSLRWTYQKLIYQTLKDALYSMDWFWTKEAYQPELCYWLPSR